MSEDFFLNLMFTSDFWINTHDTELINEFWSFVKAIYSQDPVLYNKVFPIQNLIDFMIKICTFFMLYSPWSLESQLVSNRSAAMSPTHSLTMQASDKDSNLQTNPLLQPPSTAGRDMPFYNINKYLEPIAGVLEYVLTSGGEEILAQI